MDKYKKLAANTVIFAIGTFSSKLLSFFLLPYVTRKLESGDYGAADLVQQTANVLIPIVFLQISAGALRFALDKDSNRTDVFTTGIRTMAQGYIIFLCFAYPISRIEVNDFRLGEYIVLIYLFVLTSGTRQYCQQFVRGCGNVKIFAVDGILTTGSMLLFNILFLGPMNMGVNGYIIAIIASDFCSIIFFTVTNKLWRYVSFGKVNKKTKWDMIKYSVPLMPTIILWWVMNVSDRYMVTYFINSSANGLYTAASKIPNFIIMFSTIFIEAWQLSAVDEYDSKGRADFFSKVFKVYSGGVFAVASGLIIACQLITKILVAKSYYESWQYVPILVMATTMSCFVNFLGSIYMAEKKSVMAMVTALAGAATNVVLNLILIPRMGANGAAIATVAAFMMVFVSRVFNTKKYVNVKFNAPFMALEMGILIAQCVVMIKLETGILMYAIEAALAVLMLGINYKSIYELVDLLLIKFLKRKKKSEK
ncbi:MAG: polysaccharide biosynthesis C-terminal domain-containing protein [Eubacterium sp.]|nr:polysaccharide biosynthesis C-terminal domain-containing protein [Eubacterium sp.]